jgi:hypothetical protein
MSLVHFSHDRCAGRAAKLCASTQEESMLMNFPQLLIGDGADGYVLVNRLELADAGQRAALLPAWASRTIIERRIHDPEAYELRWLATRLLGIDQPGHLDGEAVELLAARLGDCLSDETGGLVLVRIAEPQSLPRLLRRPQLNIDEAMWASATHPYAGETVLPAPQPAVVPEEKKQNVIDWYIECRHHTPKKQGERPRNIFPKGSTIQVLPDKGKISDIVKVAYRNDLEPGPGSIRVSGAAAGQAPHKDTVGPYKVYEFEAKYLGDIDQKIPVLPAFWKAYTARTSYLISHPQGSVNVDVYNPRRYKFEFSLPPTKSFKAGSRLEKDIKTQGMNPFKPGEFKEIWKREEVNWSPSSHSLDRYKNKINEWKKPGEQVSNKEYHTSARWGGIAFYRDDEEVKLEWFKLLLAIIKIGDAVKEIMDAIQENAPKVGFYFECNYQLMQGALVASCNWMEHKDHRVFHFIDVNIEMRLVKVSLEVGVGISGLGFRAQIYLNVTGESAVSLNGRHDNPDTIAGVALAFTHTIKGALGARFEVGNLLKADGRGESGIRFDTEIGINRGRSSMVSFDIGPVWLGFKVEAVVSGGLFGIGSQKKWTKELIGPRSLGKARFPDDKPYEPPVLSVERTRAALLKVITAGFNVRVIREVEGFFNRNVHWTPEQIAQALADKVMAHKYFYRSPKNVEALAHAVRKDLDEKGRVDWGRDFVAEATFTQYVNGPELQAHLDAAPSAYGDYRKALGG